MEEVAAETLPGDFAYAWAGQALQEKESGSTSSSAFIFGLIVVFPCTVMGLVSAKTGMLNTPACTRSAINY